MTYATIYIAVCDTCNVRIPPQGGFPTRAHLDVAIVRNGWRETSPNVGVYVHECPACKAEREEEDS